MEVRKYLIKTVLNLANIELCFWQNLMSRDMARVQSFNQLIATVAVFAVAFGHLANT